MELPFTCSCGHLNMVDVSQLTTRSLDKIYSEKGYVCEACKTWRGIYMTCPNLENQMKKMEKIDPGRKDFLYRFRKILKRMESVD